MDAARIMRLRISYEWFAPCGEAMVARIFQRLAADAPQTRSLFPADTAPLHPRIVALIRRVLAAGDRFSSLEPALSSMGRKLVTTAAPTHDMVVHASPLREAFLQSLAEVCGRSFSAQIRDDWRLLFDAVLGAVLVGAAAHRPVSAARPTARAAA